jgi:thioredoxin-like negative regulator of GroEL
MSARNISALKATLTSGSHGRRFTDAEETIIITAMTSAAKAKKTISVAEIRNALKDYNHAQQEESRKRAAVVNAIERLAKAGKVSKDVLSKESNGREPYTDAEDTVLFGVLEAAQKAKKQVSIPDLHKALTDSGKSPKPRSLPSVRAHIANLLGQPVEETTDGQEQAIA